MLETKSRFSVLVKAYLVIVFTLGLCLLNPQAGKAEIKVLVNANELIMDTNPVIVDGRTLVPLRAIFEALGATVQWDGEIKTVTAVRQDKTIKLQIDNTSAQVNNNAIELDTPAKIINGRTMVPVRFIAESLGENVSWNQHTQTVIIGSAPEIKPDNNIKLMPPTNLQATPLDNGYIRLTWNASTGATNYMIYKKSNSINNTYREEGKTEQTTFESGGQFQSDYWFKVKAVNDVNESDFSNEVTVKTVDPPNRRTSLTSPASVGTHFILEKGNFKIDIALVGIISGEHAWQKIHNANMFNSPPAASDKYVIAKFRVKVLEPKNMSFPLNIYDFDLYNKDGYPYPYITFVAGLNDIKEITSDIFERDICFLVRKSDSPVVVYDKGSSTEVWFKLY